ATQLDAPLPRQRLERILRTEAREVPSVTLLGCQFGLVPAGGELFRCVLVDAQVHPKVWLLNVVAALSSRDPGAQQALVRERVHHFHCGGRLRPGAKIENAFGSFERESTVENRALGESGLLPLREQVPRPIDSGS